MYPRRAAEANSSHKSSACGVPNKREASAPDQTGQPVGGLFFFYAQPAHYLAATPPPVFLFPPAGYRVQARLVLVEAKVHWLRGLPQKTGFSVRLGTVRLFFLPGGSAGGGRAGDHNGFLLRLHLVPGTETVKTGLAANKLPQK
ncbi:MAG: hypothetical protein DWH82_05350 [Planctomycetota bacterium]|nr:MAG: hypothetical protein DWH82_05350 [Planctomycetota bacterium]